MAHKVHLDTDPGCDDAVMIAMALGSPAIDVVGISTVAGNTTVENTTNNTLRLLEYFDRTEIPVAKGAGSPLVGSFDTAEWIHGPDGIRGELPAASSEPLETHGAEFIVEQAHRYGEELTIVAVAPMTNLATALVLEPDLPDLVDEIYLMGGAAMVSGNKTPMAEANFHNDAVAARRVVQSGRPRLVGLDATNAATISLETMEAYYESEPPLDTVAAWLDYPEVILELGEGSDPLVHDAVVVAHLIDDDVLTFEPYYLEVDTSYGPSRGAVVCDEWNVTENEPNADVAVATDTGRFRAVFEDAISQLEL